MQGYLEAWLPGPELVPLSGERVAIGKDGSNDVVISTDPKVSRLHAAIERFASGWTIRDVGSRNGTYVNGDRIFGEQALRDGDEVRLGQTRMVFRASAESAGTVTEAAEPPPGLTPRERDVLLALCAPLLRGSVFTEPSSVREVAAELVVTEAAVRQHLLRLYEKFEIPESGERRRVLLANEAVSRGAVTVADLRGD